MPTPSQYVIKFIADISWEGRSNGLPEAVLAYLIYEGDDSKAIVGLIEWQMNQFTQAQMMYVQRDQGQIIDLRAVPQDRVGIPFRWIVKFSVEVKKLGAEMPMPDESGVERFSDGSEPAKQ